MYHRALRRLAGAVPGDGPRLTRRSFLVTGAAAGAGLTLSFQIGTAGAQGGGAPSAVSPYDAYLRIAPDNSVTVLVAHMEMGQGVNTGVATLVAEELDADWAQMRAEGAAGNVALYGNVMMGGQLQLTGGSTAMASSFLRYRQAGATARAMLVAAAAAAWKVPAAEVTVAKGVLSHPSGKWATFGEMADAAARQPVPADAPLKAPKDWTLIGTDGRTRIDSAAKSTGAERFTIDLKLPGMLTAVVAHPPRFGAKVAGFDAAAAKAVPGVVDVVAIPTGVAVVARNSWAAMQGRKALTVTWDESAAETRGSAALMAAYKQLADRPPEVVAASTGDAEAALAGAAKLVEATYEFPYLAHAALEPMDAVAHMRDGVLEIWGGLQAPDLDQQAAARAAGIEPAKVVPHVLPTGGGFGRRTNDVSDIVVEAVETAKAIGWTAPVKVLWTREDDMRGGYYRPLFLHKVTAGVDAAGKVVGWHHRIVGQSILSGTSLQAFMQNGIDPTSVEGVADMPYAVGALKVGLTSPKVGVPVLWWRSVGHTHTAYAVETMVDELAAAAGQDPVAFRRTLLKDRPRHLGVLNLVAEKAGWGTPLPPGRFRGVAVHQSFSTFVAQVVEVTADGGDFKVERVVCAVDCGTPINPDVIRAQMEGGIGFGLGSVLHSELTLTDGRVDQGNYDGFRVLTMAEMPKVEVHIVPSAEPPTGVGEPGVPPIGPALANAVFAATGRRVRVLPFDKGLAA